jgi:hypothetical protein
MRPIRVHAVLLLFIAFGSSTAAAQQRVELVDQARAEIVGSQPALDLLLQATNPTTTPPDSTWAVGVFDLADNLINVGESDVAAVWLRWVARHGPQWPVDRDWYSPIVIGAYDIAAPAVDAAGGLGDLAATTTWRWPGAFDADAEGTIEVQPVAGVPVTVAVQNFGPLPAGGINLPPGTYVLTASSPGFEDVQVSREVLPGVATVMSFDLVPTFPAATEARVAAGLARIRFSRGGQDVCVNGVIADARGLVLTNLSGIQDANDVQVATAQGTYTDVDIGPTDDDRDLAVLRAPAGLGPALTRATGVTDLQYAFSVYQPGCGTPATARTRINGWTTPVPPFVTLLPELPLLAAGAPLVDRTGGLVGLVTGAGQALPIELADPLLADARGELVAQIPAAVGGGGGGGGVPRWVLIAGGVGAAGAGAALLLGGGGGGGGGGSGFGSITLDFPSIP